MEDKAGFQEVEHTADWELRVWAPDLIGLLEQAALGMNAISGARLIEGTRQVRRLEIPYVDPESLLVAFLSELLYFAESEGLAFDGFKLSLSDGVLLAELSGAPLAALEKEIKAVTYHRLAVEQTARGLEVRVVLDV